MPNAMSRGRSALAFVMVGCGLLAASPAQALTIASFADPTVGVSPIPYMFEVRDGAPGTLTQPLNAPTVDLSIDASLPGGGVYQDVTLAFPQLTYTGNFLAGAVMDAGYFEFIKDSQVLLRIDFQTAYLTRSGVAGDDIFSADQVSFTLLGQELELVENTASFAFSFTNQSPYPGAPSPTTGFDATAAFTSSATVIPEPATMLVLGIGSILAIRRRR